MKFYFYTGCHIAICAVLLFYGLAIRQNINVNYHSLFLIFFATWTAYLWVQLPQLSSFKSSECFHFPMTDRNYYFLKFQKRLLKFAFLLLLINLYLLKYLDNSLIFILTHLIILVFFYQIPLKNFSLRKIPYLKSILISYLWASLMTLFLIEKSLNDLSIIHQLNNFTIFVTFFDIFFFINSLNILFDLRDAIPDKISSIKTIATMRTERFTKIISACSFFLAVFLNQLITDFSLINVLFITGYLVVLKSINYKKTDYFYLAIVDSLIIIKAIDLYFVNLC